MFSYNLGIFFEKVHAVSFFPSVTLQYITYLEEKSSVPHVVITLPAYEGPCQTSMV